MRCHMFIHSADICWVLCAIHGVTGNIDIYSSCYPIFTLPSYDNGLQFRLWWPSCHLLSLSVSGRTDSHLQLPPPWYLNLVQVKSVSAFPSSDLSDRSEITHHVMGLMTVTKTTPFSNTLNMSSQRRGGYLCCRQWAQIPTLQKRDTETEGTSAQLPMQALLTPVQAGLFPMLSAVRIHAAASGLVLVTFTLNSINTYFGLSVNTKWWNNYRANRLVRATDTIK